MRRAASDRRVLRELNAINVTRDDLMNVIADQAEYRRLHPDDEDRSHANLMIIVKRFAGDSKKAHAVYCRMVAVAKFVNGGTVRGWTMPRSEDGCILTQDSVLVAAAQHPLIQRGDDVIFDEKSFLDRVLEVARPEGHA